MYPRMVVAVLIVLPVGVFMGMPFPKGALRVRSLIDWGFAVNGAASVVGATMILLVAMTWGFTVALLLGAALYLLAWLLMSHESAWRLIRPRMAAETETSPLLPSPSQ